MNIIYSLVVALILFVGGAQASYSRFALSSPPQNNSFFQCMAFSFPKSTVMVFSCACYSLDGAAGEVDGTYGPYLGVCVKWMSRYHQGCGWVLEMNGCMI